jgi:RHS repeat-associated protein
MRRRRALVAAFSVAAVLIASVNGVAFPKAVRFHPAVPDLGKPVPVRAWTAAPLDQPASAQVAPAPRSTWPASGSYPLTPAAVTWRTLGVGGVAVRSTTPTTVDVLAGAVANHYGGLALRLRHTERGSASAQVSLRVDPSVFAGRYGADYAARVRWFAGTNDATLAPIATTVEAGSTVLSTQVGPQPLTVVPLAGPTASNGTGSFAATSLSPSASWDVSAQTGSFNWNYPMRVPPTPSGPAPDLSLSYDSGSVDGRTGSTNNQPSDIGQGWDLAGGGNIERSYVGCALDDGSSGPVATSGDLCWKTDNATLTLAGHSGLLVKDTTSGVWKLEADDGTRIDRIGGPATNGNPNVEYWRVTTTDGTQYFYGSNHMAGANSAWTVPVFGNDPNEPCHGSSFATSRCNQVWRWNLDYVVDPHGNSEAFYYTKETNKYAPNGDTSHPVSYDRGGWLNRIDYGMRAGSEATTSAPERIVFDTADRCLTSCTNHAYWYDTPWDQVCTGATCTQISPTFFTGKRYTKIHTQLLSGTTYSDVDAWTLTQSFPAPGDATSPALTLDRIGHTGGSGSSTATVPDVVLHNTAKQNRVWVADGLAPLDKYRLDSITTESGAQIVVQYASPDCTPAMVDQPTDPLRSSPQTNTHRCYPQWWTPPAGGPRLDYFHKYVVASVNANPRTAGTGQPVDQTYYDYTGTPAWRYDTSPLIPTSKRTWSDFAGFNHVRVSHGDINTPAQRQSVDYTFFQGLDGDRGRPGPITVPASDGSTVTDSLWLAGRAREEITTLGVGGTKVNNTITTTVGSAPTADDGTHQARLVSVTDKVTHTALNAGGERTTEVKTTVDSYGRATEISDIGDISTPADDTCTTTTYADNTDPDHWRLAYPAEVAVVGAACTAAPSLPQDAVSDTRTYYDNHPGLTDAPSLGDATRTDVVNDYDGSTPHWQTTTTTSYDPLGRVTDVTDPRISPSRTTHTEYVPATGPVTRTIVTNPLGWITTTTFDPAWGTATSVTDANGNKTEATLDPLGRTTRVWLPDRPRASNPTPSTSYTYTISASAPTTVATTSLTPSGSTTTTYQLYDGLLRPRQTQSPSPGGGIVLTDTFYDTAGRIAATYAPYNATGNPSGTLLVPTTTVPSQTQTRYDAAGRKTAEILLANGVEKWRTSYAYGGDHVDLTAPAGGTATTTFSDARGHTTRLLQYHSNTPDGESDVTTYGYDSRGDMTSMTEPAGSIWTWKFDVLGRQTAAQDPDKGSSQTTYDAAGRIASTTDGRGTQLTYTYDALDRKTATYSGMSQLSGWTYDTLAKGQLTSSTRYVGSDAYTVAVTGYDAAYRPAGRVVTIPATQDALAGSYRTDLYYGRNGALVTQVDPSEGGLPSEALRSGYDQWGNQTGLSADGGGSYLSGTTYNHLGRVAQTTQSNGAAMYRTYTYDAGTQRLTELLTQRNAASNAVVSDRTYAYSNAGAVTSITDRPSGLPADAQCFSRDYLQRITDAWSPGNGDCGAAPAVSALGGPAPYWSSYSYDVTGNRTSFTDHSAGNTDTYTYPPATAAHPHAVQTITHTDGSVDQYSYDAEGNTSARPGQTLTWDSEDQLASVSAAGGSQTNIYDADGNLLVQSDTAGKTLFVGDTELHIATGATAATAVRTYTALGKPVAERISKPGGGTSLAFLDADPQQTATAMVDTATGAVTRRYFDAFGNPRGGTVTWPDSHGYLNAPSDQLSGLTHLGARDYDSTTGRFLSVDPILDPLDPQQNNGYAYAWNDPATHSDPAGTTPCSKLPPEDRYGCEGPGSRGKTPPAEPGRNSSSGGSGSQGTSSHASSSHRSGGASSHGHDGRGSGSNCLPVFRRMGECQHIMTPAEIADVEAELAQLHAEQLAQQAAEAQAEAARQAAERHRNHCGWAAFVCDVLPINDAWNCVDNPNWSDCVNAVIKTAALVTVVAAPEVVVADEVVETGEAVAAETAPEMISGTNARGLVTSRGSFRKSTLQDAWDNAGVGPNGGRLCPTCGGEVEVPPNTGVPRDWDGSHFPSWSNRQFPSTVTRGEVLDNYNEGVWLECPVCNRGAGNNDARFGGP